jgi:hypothetical protein
VHTQSAPRGYRVEIGTENKKITRLPPLGSHVVWDIVWTGVVVGSLMWYGEQFYCPDPLVDWMVGYGLSMDPCLVNMVYLYCMDPYIPSHP